MRRTSGLPATAASVVAAGLRGRPATADASRSPRARRWLRSVAAVLLLAGVVAWVGPAQMAATLRQTAWPWFAAAVACAIAANLLSAWRWGAIARALGLRARFGALLSAYAQGIAVNTVLPGATLGGDALRALRLAQAGNDGVRAAASVLLDRASGLWVLCAVSLLALAGLVVAGDATRAVTDAAVAPALPGLAVVAAALLVALPLPLLFGPGPAVARADSPRWARLRALRRLLHARRGPLLRSLLPSVGVQLLSAGTLWLCARAAGADVQPLAMLVVAAPIFLAAALPLSIGGFGPREAAAALCFPWIGATAEAGVAAAALYGLTAALQGALGAPLLALSPDPASSTGRSN